MRKQRLVLFDGDSCGGCLLGVMMIVIVIGLIVIGGSLQ